jgi:hypothetical protein
MDDEKDVINDSENIEGNGAKKTAPEENLDETIKSEVSTEACDEEILTAGESQCKGKMPFLNSLTVSVVDTAVISLVSVILLYLIDFVMRNTVGLYITDKVTFLFILFVLTTALYPCLMNTFRGCTVGTEMVKSKK